MLRNHAIVWILSASIATMSCASPPPPTDTVGAEGQVSPAALGETAAGDVQDRGVSKAPGAAALGMQVSPGRIVKPGLIEIAPVYPGEFAVRTQNGFYLTAINGGGRTTDPIVVTSSTAAGPWEKFKIMIANPQTSHDKFFQTANGNYLTAVNGGGMSANVLHSDATQANDWERFRLLNLGGYTPGYYAIQTIKGFYMTAVGAGGRYQDAIHTDAREIKGWEQFRITKCGDPGSGYEYAVMAADGEFLASTNYENKLGFGLAARPSEAEMKYKLVRQNDGTYALQTASGRYLTALGGGGQVEKYNSKYYTPDCGIFSPCIGGSAPIFHTDATQIQAWEKFRIVDQGNCTYAIQTSSGFYAGIYKDASGVMLLTTRRDGAPTPNEKFHLVVFGLASPVVIQ
ncbi:hypothetical protein W02_03510 [Nitrospira sp. KM1]|uniref:fascin domain-containing protein n=1 Tax=Nitrospira sp. KM1 TaxID=1936990 RepID=UPI0013A798DF|nr:hypothetical protein [Nitrospira sp. KM1]BCA53211.1 hypothetical protein W02_03510 [Nitrospira sp. KM1]